MNSDRLWKHVENKQVVIGVSVVVLIALAVGFIYLTPAVPDRPERPEKLTNETVQEYVTGYERAEVFRDRNPDGRGDFTLECSTRILRATQRGYYAVSRCHGSSVATFVTGGSFYLINETTTIRVPTHDQKRIDQTNTGSFRGIFYIANFDNRDYSITVRVENMTNSRVALNQSYMVQAKEGIGQSHVAPPGQYVIIATSDRGDEIRYEWDISSDTAARRTLAIYLTPKGQLLIQPIPESQ